MPYNGPGRTAIATATLIYLCLCAESAPGQALTKEYIRLNGTVVAIENATATSDPVPQLISLSPQGGVGPSTTFTAIFSDNAGAANIQDAHIKLSAPGGNCHVVYYKAYNQLFLDNTAASWNYVANGNAGSPVVLQSGLNTVCTVDLAFSSVTLSGNQLILSLRIAFKSGAYGTYTSSLLATNATGATAWTAFGNWDAEAGTANGSIELYGNIQGKPAVAVNSDGRVEVLARWSDNSLSDIAQTTPSGNWTGWSGLGNGLLSNPALAVNTNGKLQGFFRGGDSTLWTITQSSAGGPSWDSSYGLGGTLAAEPAVAANADGRLEVLTLGSDATVSRIAQNSPGGSWSGWSNISGNFAGPPAVALNSNGELEAFARGSDNQLWHAYQTTPGGSWSAWATLGNQLLSNPAVVKDANGYFEVFFEGGDASMWHIRQTSSGWGSSSALSLGGTVGSDPSAVLDANGNVEVFMRGSNGALWFAQQLGPGSSSWSGFTSLGASLGDGPRAILNSNSEIQVFFRNTDNTMSFTTQTSPGAWPVTPYANYRICNSTTCGTSGISFNHTDQWELYVDSNVANSSFNVHVSGATTGSSVANNYGTTDGNGFWMSPAPGNFAGVTNDNYTEWVEFPSLVNSNTINFTVHN